MMEDDEGDGLKVEEAVVAKKRSIKRRIKVEGLTQCGAGKKTARRFMSNTFLQSSKEFWCIIFAPYRIK